MNRTELVSAMAEKTGLSKKEADSALKAFMETVKEELNKGNKIQLVGFGTYEVVERAAREGRNPATGEKKMLPASKRAKCKMSKSILD